LDAPYLAVLPRERLLIEAGRVPADLKPFLSQSRVPALLRAVGKLSEIEQEELLKMVEALALKQHRKRGR